MATLKQNPALPVGSWIYRNWQAALAGAPEEFAEELLLYSDARFLGEFRTGLLPFVLLNTVPEPHELGSLVPALALRISGHLKDDTDQIVEAFRTGIPDSNSFTGGTAYDEITSLIALSHTVRLAHGAPNRWFHKHDTDGRGTPRHSAFAAPNLQRLRSRTILPTVCRSVALSIDLLQTYPRLAWESARELARAARSYRQAVWTADADGNLAWLLLVAAAETAANEWARQQRLPSMTPSELLEDLRPDFTARLRVAAGDKVNSVLGEVGGTLADVLRAQWKFTTFLMTFGLSAPQPRPNAWPLEWSMEAIKPILGVVYKYRSEALHASKPFPLPMCEAPFPSEDDTGSRAWSERPGGASYQAGGLWTEAQLPINLHAFHHLVATAVTAWWKSLPLEAHTAPTRPSGAA